MKTYLRLCAEIETTIEKAYLVLAEQAGTDKDFRQLWQRLAHDESDHAHQLQLAERLCSEDCFDDQRLDDEDVRGLLEEAKQFLIQVNSHRLPPLEAIKTAIVMEKKFMAVHVHRAATFASESLRHTFNALSRSDEAHFKTLTTYLLTHRDRLFESP